MTETYFGGSSHFWKTCSYIAAGIITYFIIKKPTDTKKNIVEPHV